LPERSIEYVKEALTCLKPGGVCHFYCFATDTDDKKDKIKQTAKLMKKKIKFIEEQKVLPYGPKIWKYRLDFELIE